MGNKEDMTWLLSANMLMSAVIYNYIFLDGNTFTLSLKLNILETTLTRFWNGLIKFYLV